MRTSLVSLLVLVAACGSEPQAEQPTFAGQPGQHSVSVVQAEGIVREAIVYVPSSYASDAPAPVLLNFHGFGGTAAEHLEWADFRELADAEGFIAVYPQGSLLEGETHWNPSLPGPGNKSDAEDFDFVVSLLDQIGSDYAVDRDRVYATGYSNGAMMAYALACFEGEHVAAIAAVSGAMLDDIGVDCTPPETSVLLLHGTQDFVLPYAGGDGFGSVDQVVTFWLGVNGIDGPGEESSTAEGTVSGLRHEGGGVAVHRYRVEGAGHVWFDVTVDGASVEQLIWAFVSGFERG
ncbi:MAG: hypothetical protein KC912_22925 [Proteobacteria bacterium]|nr:hypothetical protein [Pseudomonadota bacterium]